MENIENWLKLTEQTKFNSQLELLIENYENPLLTDIEKDSILKFYTYCTENSNSIIDELKNYNQDEVNEGFLGSILGGLTGFALGSAVGKVFAKILGVERGLLYDLLTSKIVTTAVGIEIGKNF